MGRIRNSRRTMRGGDWLDPSTWDTSSLNPSSWSLFSSGTQADADAKAQAQAQAQAQTPAYTVAPAGGRRRRRRKRLHGGNVMPNSPLSGFASDAMEVHDIKMAQPQTLVGGRRRRKSSKRRGRTARKSKSRSSRRN